MLRKLKLATALVLVTILLLGIASTVAAADESHLYGLVFIDANRNGV